MFQKVDFSEEKAQLEKEIEVTKNGQERVQQEVARFKEIEKEIEEFIESIITGMGPFRLTYRPQRDTLICLQTLGQLKNKKVPTLQEVNVFITIVKQDLGEPTANHLHKMIFGVKNG